MEDNMENGDKVAPANCSITSAVDESTLYYSMDTSGDIVKDLEELDTTMQEEEAVISIEIPDLSPGASLPDPLAICDKFLRKHAIMSSTPNRLTVPPSDHKVSSISEEILEEVLAPAEQSKDETLQEKNAENELTMKSDTSDKDYVSLKQILVDLPEEKQPGDVAEKKDEVSQSKETEIVEIQEIVVARVTEDLIRVVIEEEPDNEQDIPLEREPDKDKESVQIKQERDVDQAREVTSQPEQVPEKDENKENSNKKQRRRSKIAVSTNQAPKEQKVTGKQSLIRRSILKTEVKSPANLVKSAPFNVMKRSSLLPRNMPAAQKRQTIAPLSKASASLVKQNPVQGVRVHPPVLKKRQTLAPSVANPSRSGQISPKGILSTKNPTIVNKSPKFLHPKDVKPKDFECKVCKKKFRTALLLGTHSKTHKESSRSGNTCKYCDRRFEIKQGLENHIQKYCTKIPVGEKRRLLEAEAKNNALTPRTKRLIKASSSASSEPEAGSSASSSSDLMSMLKYSPGTQGSAKRRSVAFSGISATPNRTIKCYQCLKEFIDVFEFSDHITEHVEN